MRWFRSITFPAPPQVGVERRRFSGHSLDVGRQALELLLRDALLKLEFRHRRALGSRVANRGGDVLLFLLQPIVVALRLREMAAALFEAAQEIVDPLLLQLYPTERQLHTRSRRGHLLDGGAKPADFDEEGRQHVLLGC